MNFKLVSKNNTGLFATFVLVILLCQSRFFNFLTQTPLGRLFLLAFIIFISYINQFLGLLSVLFIIIAFYQYDTNIVQSYNYYEGFEMVKLSKPKPQITLGDNQMILEAEYRRAEQEKLRAEQEKLRAEYRRKTEDEVNRKIAEDYERRAKAKAKAKAKGKSKVERIAGNVSVGAKEGFCMTDRETNILRGKQSNTIPVYNNSREQDDDVSPSDKSVFSSDFALF